MTPSDEAERVYLRARYNVSDTELSARTAAAPCMGCSLLVALNEFVEMKMSTQKIQACAMLLIPACETHGMKACQ